MRIMLITFTNAIIIIIQIQTIETESWWAMIMSCATTTTITTTTTIITTITTATAAIAYGD